MIAWRKGICLLRLFGGRFGGLFPSLGLLDRWYVRCFFDCLLLCSVKVMVGWSAATGAAPYLPFVLSVMSSWAARMHRRAATFSNVVTSCGHPSGPYPRRLEKVKFGVALEEVCKNDIPGPLLVSRFEIPQLHHQLFRQFKTIKKTTINHRR